FGRGGIHGKSDGGGSGATRHCDARSSIDASLQGGTAVGSSGRQGSRGCSWKTEIIGFGRRVEGGAQTTSGKHQIGESGNLRYQRETVDQLCGAISSGLQQKRPTQQNRYMTRKKETT